MRKAAIACFRFALVGSWLIAASAQAADGGACFDGGCPSPVDAAAPEADASDADDASTPSPGSSADGGWVRMPRYTSEPPLPVAIDPNQAPPQSWPSKQNEPKSVEDAGAIPATDLEFTGGREKHACGIGPTAQGAATGWAMLSAVALCIMCRRRKVA